MLRSFTTSQAMRKNHRSAMIYRRLLRFSLLMFFGTLAGTGSAFAQACAPSLAVLTNGTTADADPVNSNFSTLLGCANGAAPLSNPHFTGNVGIGTSSPSAPLTIVPPSDGVSIFVDHDGTQGHMGAIGFSSGYSQKWVIGTGDTIGTARQFIISESGGADYWPQYIFNSGAGSADASLDVLDKSGSSKIRLSTFQDSYVISSGHFGIGTASPAATLTVVGNVRVGTSGTNGCLQNFAGTSLAGTCSSDAALKTIKGDVTNVLDKVANLQLVRFTWNKTAQKVYHNSTAAINIGFVAQDVAVQFPELVSFDSEGYRQLDYSTLSLYGLEAIKELKARNDRQASEIAEMKSRLAIQEQRLAQIEKFLAVSDQRRNAEGVNLKPHRDDPEHRRVRQTAENTEPTLH